MTFWPYQNIKRLLSSLMQHPLDINSGSALRRAESQCAYVTPFPPSRRLVRNGRTAPSEVSISKYSIMDVTRQIENPTIFSVRPNLAAMSP